MNPKWRALAGDMLEMAADEFSNHGCNDWEWPAAWTVEERQQFADAMNAWSGDDELPWTGESKWGPGDSFVMRFLADVLRKEP